MFIVKDFKDFIKIKPEYLNGSLREHIIEYLSLRFANKVILNVGLCVVLLDLISIREPQLVPVLGASYSEVKFKYFVFRPRINETVIGKIKYSSSEGVHVSLKFFDNILIPADSLQCPSRFDQNNHVWIWENNNSEGEDVEMIMKSGEAIRFRVVSETFDESIPNENVLMPNNNSSYKIVGSINGLGLGLMSWWNNPGPDGTFSYCEM